MQIVDRLKKVQLELTNYGCSPDIMLVSKTQIAETVEHFLINGHKLFGENRVQEAAAKWPELLVKYRDCQLHLIGPLQTNKAKQALQLFHVIQSLDRPKLAEKLSDLEKSLPKRQYYIQVNIGEEPQKSGVMPHNLNEFNNYCVELGLNVTGLMCIPPMGQNPEPYFKKARMLNDALKLDNLSMGMSADYLIAASQGATMVRLGSIIFGDRK